MMISAFLHENDRICSYCPHATAMLIIASYVDDNLAFTNCATLSAEFEVHCNVKFLMNAEGPVKYSSDDVFPMKKAKIKPVI